MSTNTNTGPQLWDTFDICLVYVAALEYGDDSGLEPGEDKAVEDWLDTLPAGAWFNWGEDQYFAEDEISGLLADCIQCEVYYRAETS